MSGDNHGEIVIKKVKKGGHGGHHGGAWKVAYADFVTAMMAFFLLLWLLNATTEEQKLGISNYFDPTAISRSTRSGSGGVLGGISVTVPGAQKSPSSPPTISTPVAARPNAEQTEAIEADSDDPENIESRFGADEDAFGSSQFELGTGDLEGDKGNSREPGTGGTEIKFGEGEEQGLTQIREGEGEDQGLSDRNVREIARDQLDRLIEERERQEFEKVEAQLKQAIQDTPELEELKDNLIVEQTPEGLRIQIVDQEQRAMFPNGSADMFGYTQELIGQVATIVQRVPNKMTITGHTDALQFAPGSGYSNWELSADRANSSRRALIDSGIPAERIAWVVGKADNDPLFPEEPTSARNRRISIVLLRDSVLRERLNSSEVIEERQNNAAVVSQ
ncbi:MAG: OmpA family protein [Alphaproteobacteria bacterium]|nr:OmpA family protein [Alphaproteobacteria bacterium]